MALEIVLVQSCLLMTPSKDSLLNKTLIFTCVFCASYLFWIGLVVTYTNRSFPVFGSGLRSINSGFKKMTSSSSDRTTQLEFGSSLDGDSIKISGSLDLGNCESNSNLQDRTLDSRFLHHSSWTLAAFSLMLEGFLLLVISSAWLC